jgi:hypothetical protein
MKNLALFGLVIGLAACGEVVGAKHNDAGAVDADTTDASLSGTANIVTQSEISGSGNTGDVAANIQLIALRPNDTLQTTATTDANGSAALAIYPGGSVTAVYPHTGSGDMGYDLVTYLDVEDGDKLTFGSYNANQPPTTVGTVTFTWTAFAGTNYYEIYWGCGQDFVSAPTVSTVPETIASNCIHGTSPFYAQVVAYNNSGIPIGSTFATLATVTATQTMSLGTLATIGSTSNLTLTATGLPVEVDDVQTEVFDVANGGSTLGETGSSGAPNSGAISLTQVAIQGGDRLAAELILYPNNNENGRMYLYDGLIPQASAWPVAAPTFPPWTTSAVAPPASGQILWFSDATPGTSDEQASVVQWGWERQTTVGGVPVDTIYNWTFIVPPGVRTIKLPTTLPAAVQSLLPGPDDFYDTPTVYLLEVPSVTGYKGIKTLPERTLVCPACAVEAGDVPRMIYSQQVFER